MLAIEIELLAGRYVATAHDDRGRAEWPPHPARFFSALVAALHDNEPVEDVEREALLWLEQQPPPHLDVDLVVDEDVGRRDVRDVWVPVNDVTLVGDPEAPLRDKRTALAILEASQDATESEIKKRRKEIEKAEGGLLDFIKRQSEIDVDPAKKALATARALLPDFRTRQLRTFPAVVPGRATFAFVWPDSEAAAHRDPLDRLCQRVTRLGHSSSLVRCRLIAGEVQPTLVPDPNGDTTLRVVGPGQLVRLEREHARHQGVESRVLPARPQRYAEPQGNRRARPREGIFSEEWVSFERVGGARPLASRGTDLTLALRRALIEAHGDETLPAALSGHGVDGDRTSVPHVAFVACPFVGHDHADGSIQGLALVLPRNLAARDRETLLRLVARWEKARELDPDDHTLEIGTSDPHRIAVRLRRVDLPSKYSLRPRTWSNPSRRFVTATPIALDRHPGNLRSNRDATAARAAREAEESIALACEHIGLPRPMRVGISLAPLISGAQHVRDFVPWRQRAGRVKRARVHAEIVFADPVRGPVILGAGRYFGLGLCLPIRDAKETAR